MKRIYRRIRQPDSLNTHLCRTCNALTEPSPGQEEKEKKKKKKRKKSKKLTNER